MDENLTRSPPFLKSLTLVSNAQMINQQNLMTLGGRGWGRGGGTNTKAVSKYSAHD